MKACRFLFVWALLPIIMFSCNREQERIETPVSTPVGEVTFNASFGDAQNTRTVIKNDTEIWWSPNDAINVFYGDLTSGKFTATAGQESASAQFVGSFSAVTGIMEAENESRSFWAVYPYDVLNSCDGNSVTLTVPIKQKGAEGTFAPKTFPAIANSAGLDLAFYNVCGGIVLTITRDDIRAITLTGNNDEIIAGTIRVDFEDGLPAIKEIVTGEKSITFRSPNNKPFIPGTKYFITAIPGTFSQGFKLKFIAANGDEGLKNISDSKTINRSRFLVVNDADANVSFAPNENNANIIHFVDLDLKDKLVAAFDKDGDGDLSYDEAAAVESADDIFSAFGDEKGFQFFNEFQYFTGITTIPNYMFQDWVKLESIELPETIVSIGEYSFNRCSQLAEITIPANVKTMGKFVLSGCSRLASVVLPSGLMSIPEDGFSYCYSLSSIIIPDGVTRIDRGAFYNCNSLKSISLPSQLNTVGTLVFSGCSIISNVYFEVMETLYMLINNNSMPWANTNQPVHIFVAGKEITSISIPDSFTTIPTGAFRQWGSLGSVTIPEGCQSIGGSAFSGCTSLLSVTIPEGCQSIGGSAFSGCTSLLSVTIPKSCQSIGNGAFRDCTSLLSVTIPEGCQSIEAYAFWHCSSLKAANLSEGLLNIGAHAFNSCTALITFEFPSSIKSIGMSVLQSSKGLTSITVKAVEVPTSGGVAMFDTYGGDCPIYVPEESIDAYKSAPYWSGYASRIMPIMAEGDDPDVINNVTAQYTGGSISLINGVIQQNSKLNFAINNNSSKTIKVLTIQLVDGVTGQTGNMMSVNKTISPSNSAGWTITIGSGGIHSPIAKFVFTCGGKRYEISAKYRSI